MKKTYQILFCCITAALVFLTLTYWMGRQDSTKPTVKQEVNTIAITKLEDEDIKKDDAVGTEIEQDCDINTDIVKDCMIQEPQQYKYEDPENEAFARKAKGLAIISQLRSNYKNLEKASYNIEWESLNDDKGDSSYSTEVNFKKPFYYLEKATGGRIYTYFSEGTIEQFIYDNQDYDFVKKNDSPELDALNEGSGFLEKFPLRILHTKDMSFSGEETIETADNKKIDCEVVQNEYWKIFVSKDNKTIIRADYFREKNRPGDIIVSLTDFEYSKVEVGENKDGEKEFMEFPASFKATSPSTKYSWKCNVSGMKVNENSDLNESQFEFRTEFNLRPEL